MVVNGKKDVEDLVEVNKKWKNQFGILTEIEEMSKVSLTESEEKSVVKLFEDDSNDEVDSAKIEKEVKAKVKKENKKNVPHAEGLSSNGMQNHVACVVVCRRRKLVHKFTVLICLC